MNRCASSAMGSLFIVILVAAVCSAQAPSVEDIRRAWEARTKATGKIRVAWKTTRTDAKGFISTTAPQKGLKRMGVAGQIIPEADATVTSLSTLSLDGNKVRYRFEDTQYIIERKAYRREVVESVYDNGDYKELLPEGGSDLNWPCGRIRRGEFYTSAGLTDLRPLVMTFRPCVPTLFSMTLDQLSLTGRSAKIDDYLCYELEHVYPDGAREEFWIDPKRDCVVVRQMGYTSKYLLEQLTIRYRPFEPVGWVPETWNYVRRSNRGITQSGQIRVTNLSLAPVFGPEEFKLTFPPGCVVSNHRNRDYYLIKMDGSKRNILQADTGASYEKMLETNAGEALGVKRKSWNLSWGILATTALGVLCLMAFVVRRFRK